jgi:O-antigen ligase
MDEERAERGSPLAVILPVSIVIAVLGYVVSLSFGSVTEESFLPYGFTIAIFIYLLTFVDIRIGLASLMLAIGISPEMDVGGVSNLRLEDFIVPVIFFAWFTRLIVHRESFKSTILKWPIILYIVTAVFSALLGLSYGSVQPRTVMLVIGKTIEYFMIFLIVLNNINTERDFKAFVILAIVISILSCFATYLRAPTIGLPQQRLMGPFGETANILGGYLVLHMGLVIGLFLVIENMNHKILLGVAFAILFYTLMFTYSRTSYIAFAVGVILFGLLKQRKVLLIGIAGLIIFPLLAPAEVISRAATTEEVVRPRPGSFAARVSSWEEALEKTIHSPFFGYGPSFTRLGDVDNEYVRIIQDMGIVGLLVFLWFLFMILKEVFRMYTETKENKFLFGFVSGYMLSFFCILIHALGATSFTCIRTMEGFMVLTALVFVVVNHYNEWTKPPIREGLERAPRKVYKYGL